MIVLCKPPNSQWFIIIFSTKIAMISPCQNHKKTHRRRLPQRGEGAAGAAELGDARELRGVHAAEVAAKVAVPRAAMAAMGCWADGVVVLDLLGIFLGIFWVNYGELW